MLENYSEDEINEMVIEQYNRNYTLDVEDRAKELMEDEEFEFDSLEKAIEFVLECDEDCAWDGLDEDEDMEDLDL